MKLAVAVATVSLLFTTVAEAKGAKNRKSASFATTTYAPSGSTTSSALTVGSTKSETYRRPDDRSGDFGVAATAGLLYFDFGYGMDLWFMASQKLQLGLQINHVETEIDSRKQSGETSFLNEYLNMDLTGFKGQARYFVWNSLFVSGGASYNTVEGEYGFMFGDTQDHAGRKFSAQMAMAHVGLGNQWKLRNGLVLGGEWIGVGAHLATAVKDKGDASVYSDESGTSAADDGEYDRAAFEKKVKGKLENQIQFSIAMMTLGYEF
jgi:hypothetical protein